MPTAQRTRTIAASPQEVWEVLGDPHHLPRWWPRVSRVEAVTLTPHDGGQAGSPDEGERPEGHTQGAQGGQAGESGAFTEVLMSPKGKIVRADFKLLATPGLWRIVWSQQIENTPFARVLNSSETEISLADAHGSDGPLTEVTIELRQTTHGFLARLGAHLVRRAAGSTIDEALDGLERILGRRT